jgi:hypothetical protein
VNIPLLQLAVVNTDSKQERYVAECLYCTSEDQPQTVIRVVDCADNHAYLEADAFRLALCQQQPLGQLSNE